MTSAGPFIIAAALGTLASVTGLILVLRDRAALSRKRKENPVRIQLTMTVGGHGQAHEGMTTELVRELRQAGFTGDPEHFTLSLVTEVNLTPEEVPGFAAGFAAGMTIR